MNLQALRDPAIIVPSFLRSRLALARRLRICSPSGRRVPPRASPGVAGALPFDMGVYMKTSIKFALKAGAAPLVLSIALAAAPAFADDLSAANITIAPDAAAPAPAANTDVIVVTGSRIANPNLKSISPISSISSADIAASGTVKVEDLLSQLPQVFAAQSSTLSNGSDGTATISLRNLGDNRTLVLIDGRRLMPGDPTSSAADVNFVPESLLKRVDVLTGGASATYGADAVAGVVNFVMDTDFTGFKLDLNNGLYQDSSHNSFMQGLLNNQTAAGNSGYGYPTGNVADGDNFDGTLSYGAKFADGRGHISAYLGYRHSEAVTQNQRDYSACTLASSSGCGGSHTSAVGNGIIWGPYGAGGAQTSTFGSLGHGKIVPLSSNLYNYAPTNYFQRPDSRYTAGAFVNYDAGPSAHLYMELMYMNDHSLAQIAPSGDFGNTKTINCNNPLLTAQEISQICTTANTVIGYLEGSYPVTNGFVSAAGMPTQPLTPAAPGTAYFQLFKRNTDGGPRTDDLNHKDFRGVWGSKGDLGKAWTYDAYYQYGQVQYDETYLNDVSLSALTNALNVVAGPNGTAVCASAAAVAAGCVPYDVFSGNGVSQAATNYVTANGTKTGKNTEQIADISFTGNLSSYGIKSPKSENDVMLNIGGEFRRETILLNPDLEFSTGDLTGQGGPQLKQNGHYNVFEFISELNAPLVSNGTSNVLNFEGAFRYSHYDYGGNTYDENNNVTGTYTPSFNTVTWKLGLTFQPVSDLTLRGGINRAVRAPDLNEMFGSDHVQLDGSTDPCSTSTVGSIAATNAGCLSQQNTRVGQVINQNPAGQYNGLVGGNPTLTPEVAITKSLGAIFAPHGIRGLSLSIDYYDINIKNAIQPYGADTILAACDSAPGSALCSLINRDPAGSLWLSNNGYVVDIEHNIGGVDTRGIDVNLQLRHKAGFGTVTAGIDGSYLLRYLVNNGLTPSYDCAGYYGVTCGNPIPHWRHKANVGLTTNGGFSAQVAWRYVGAATIDYLNPSSSVNNSSYTTSSYGAKIGAQSYFDLSMSANILSRFTWRMGVNNLFDKNPPIVDTPECAGTICNGNTYPGTYDALGRYLYTSVVVKF